MVGVARAGEDLGHAHQGFRRCQRDDTLMGRALRQVVETALVDKLHKNVVVLGFLQDGANRAAVGRPG